MEYLIVCLASLLASGLTLFSGFGLGTILTPVFAIFFPVPVAIAATAVVHLANNIFKLFLVGQNSNKKILIRFGIPAVVAAFLGAFLLKYVSAFPVLWSYSIAEHRHEITLVKLIIGFVIILFSALELNPHFQKKSIDEKYMPIGGILSGFFGGLSGHQGALRSMFLIRAGLSKEEFIGTNVALAIMVDMGRLIVYGMGFYSSKFLAMDDIKGLVLAATFFAFIGAYIGMKFFKKVTLTVIQNLVGIMLIFLGLGLSTGLL
ncbi:MAG: sulfite exporter TauE/SafE family protein [Candidatus Omnitrophica bacterium]|nr:sulfite exporter TauE/SafE family protein [Candidatus Omnitrophota bacterium]